MEIEGLGARHQSTQHLMQFFIWAHLPKYLQRPPEECFKLAVEMVTDLPDGPELTAGLRKLLEAKDCFVRAAITKLNAPT